MTSRSKFYFLFFDRRNRMHHYVVIDERIQNQCIGKPFVVERMNESVAEFLALRIIKCHWNICLACFHISIQDIDLNTRIIQRQTHHIVQCFRKFDFVSCLIINSGTLKRFSHSFTYSDNERLQKSTLLLQLFRCSTYIPGTLIRSIRYKNDNIPTIVCLREIINATLQCRSNRCRSLRNEGFEFGFNLLGIVCRKTNLQSSIITILRRIILSMSVCSQCHFHTSAIGKRIDHIRQQILCYLNFGVALPHSVHTVRTIENKKYTCCQSIVLSCYLYPFSLRQKRHRDSQKND